MYHKLGQLIAADLYILGLHSMFIPFRHFLALFYVTKYYYFSKLFILWDLNVHICLGKCWPDSAGLMLESESTRRESESTGCESESESTGHESESESMEHESESGLWLWLGHWVRVRVRTRSNTDNRVKNHDFVDLRRLSEFWKNNFAIEHVEILTLYAEQWTETTGH